MPAQQPSQPDFPPDFPPDPPSDSPPDSPSDSPPDSESRPKSTLFCPECDHESDVAGDWRVREVDSRDVYECPVCDTTITKRLRPLLAP